MAVVQNCSELGASLIARHRILPAFARFLPSIVSNQIGQSPYRSTKGRLSSRFPERPRSDSEMRRRIRHGGARFIIRRFRWADASRSCSFRRGGKRHATSSDARRDLRRRHESRRGATGRCRAPDPSVRPRRSRDASATLWVNSDGRALLIEPHRASGGP
jgi:hypothetical protein